MQEQEEQSAANKDDTTNTSAKGNTGTADTSSSFDYDAALYSIQDTIEREHSLSSSTSAVGDRKYAFAN